MRLFTTKPPENHAGAWKFIETRFRDASKAWSDSDPTLSAVCEEIAVLMAGDTNTRELAVSEMDVAIRDHWLGFAQLVVGMPSYNVIWNSSAAYREQSRMSAEQREVSHAPDRLDGTNELLEDEIALIELLPKGSPYEHESKGDTPSGMRSIPKSIEECSRYTADRVDEVGRHWNRSIPWLAQICYLLATILKMPHRDREIAFNNLDNRLKLRLTGALMLVGGNGLFASAFFPTVERLNTSPRTADISVEFFEDRNARVSEHFRQRQQWLAS